MTRARTAVKPDDSPVQTPTATAIVPFGLTLSAPAKRILLRDETGATLWESQSDVAAEVEANWPRLPRSVQIEVTWTDATVAPRYFAKLRLDPPGRDTLTHVFDAGTHLDDLWELP